MTDISVEYTRRLYDDVVKWYESADTKAQVALGIDGAFLAFLTSGMFAKPQDLSVVVAGFSAWTWSLLGLLLLTLLGSIAAALWCIRSRVYSNVELEQLVNQEKDPANQHYKAKVMWFFQMVGRLEEERFLSTLNAVDGDFERKALAAQIQILSRNVTDKHRYANRGLLLAVVTLLLFLAAGVSYVLRNAVISFPQ